MPGPRGARVPAGWHRWTRLGAYRCALAQEVIPPMNRVPTSPGCAAPVDPKRSTGATLRSRSRQTSARLSPYCGKRTAEFLRILLLGSDESVHETQADRVRACLSLALCKRAIPRGIDYDDAHAKSLLGSRRDAKFDDAPTTRIRRGSRSRPFAGRGSRCR